jgi:hypothetical protein
MSIYRYLIVKYAGLLVESCRVIAVKDKEVYDIFPASFEQVEKLLYGGTP